MEAYFIAQICLFGGNFAPRSWAFCAGQLMSIEEYSPLFSLVGTTYGGDGQTTFGLPDFRGRIPVGAGQGPGLSNIQLGQMAGTPDITLTIPQMPSHTHQVQFSVGVNSSTGNNANPANAVISGTSAPFYTAAANASSNLGGTTATVQNAGGNQPFPNMMPYLGINFVIALEGIFPSRN